MEYGEGKYYDEEMADIIADAAERECMEIAADVQAEADAEEAYRTAMEQEDWENRSPSWIQKYSCSRERTSITGNG